MKNNNLLLSSALVLLLLVLSSGTLYANTSAEAMSLSGSFSTRARGTRANYWNPANLIFAPATQGEFLMFNTTFGISNNAFSVRKYNELNGKYLSSYEKDKIISALDGELQLNGGFSHSIGIAMENYAITTQFNVFTKGRFSSDYVRLLLYGNEYDKPYRFDKKKNYFEFLAYSDLTYGKSVYSFELYGYTFHTGVALSLLSGLFSLETIKYDGDFQVSDDGIYYDQEIIVRKGTGGVGMKCLAGIRNDFSEEISLSLAVDNLFGFMTWRGSNEEMAYGALVDNIYLSSLDQIIIQTADSTKSIPNYTTILHPSINFGTQYTSGDISLSLDWKQGFTNSVLTSKTPEIAMGLELLQVSGFPFRVGIKPGLGNNPYSVSYGVGVRSSKLSVSLGVESVRAIIPSSYSEGMSFAITSKWSF